MSAESAATRAAPPPLAALTPGARTDIPRNASKRAAEAARLAISTWPARAARRSCNGNVEERDRGVVHQNADAASTWTTPSPDGATTAAGSSASTAGTGIGLTIKSGSPSPSAPSAPSPRRTWRLAVKTGDAGVASVRDSTDSGGPQAIDPVVAVGAIVPIIAFIDNGLPGSSGNLARLPGRAIESF